MYRFDCFQDFFSWSLVFRSLIVMWSDYEFLQLFSCLGSPVLKQGDPRQEPGPKAEHQGAQRSSVGAGGLAGAEKAGWGGVGGLAGLAGMGQAGVPRIRLVQGDS